MLTIKKIEPADRLYLGWSKYNPLSRIFKIAVQCDQNEEIKFEVMGTDCKEVVEKGQTYHLLACQYNRLSQKTPEIGDTFTLEELSNSDQLHVLDSDTLILWKWGNDKDSVWDTMEDWGGELLIIGNQSLGLSSLSPAISSTGKIRIQNRD